MVTEEPHSGTALRTRHDLLTDKVLPHKPKVAQHGRPADSLRSATRAADAYRWAVPCKIKSIGKHERVIDD